MAKEDDIKKFLNDFKTKVKIFGIVYLNREKNVQGILDLEIRSFERDEYLRQLVVQDYCEGPLKDGYAENNSDYWVFGKMINAKETYIKVSLGNGKKALCMSFHVAEHKMNYPLKIT